MSDFDRRALLQALQADAARMGITVSELIKRITSGGQVVGAGQDREMIDPATYMSTGEGHMPQIHNRLPADGGDDFDELVQAREGALVDAEGDDLAREAIMRERNSAALNAFQPFTNTNPRSAVDAVLGSNAVVVCGGQLVTVCYWVAQTDSETSNINLALQPRNQPPASGTGAIFRPFARVKWGTRSSQFSADVDVARGTQLSLNASAITVEAGLAADVSGNAPNDLTMNIIGSLSFGGGGRAVVPVTRTVWMDTPSGSETFFTVPAFAKRLSVITRTSAIATARQVNLKDSIGNAFSVQIAANGQLTVPIDLWDDIIVVSQTTAGLVDVGPCAFIFELAF